MQRTAQADLYRLDRDAVKIRILVRRTTARETSLRAQIGEADFSAAVNGRRRVTAAEAQRIADALDTTPDAIVVAP